MPIASDEEVQNFANSRIRVRAEQLRALINGFASDRRAIPDVYQAAVRKHPTWTDSRPDGPPRLLTPEDVLNYDLVSALFVKVVEGTATAADVKELSARIPQLLTACVRPVTSF